MEAVDLQLYLIPPAMHVQCPHLLSENKLCDALISRHLLLTLPVSWPLATQTRRSSMLKHCSPPP